tara:strand:+ start:356 stop:2713 length:2358 start_codon:yes stop_codon:yes gene_type:complete
MDTMSPSLTPLSSTEPSDNSLKEEKVHPGTLIKTGLSGNQDDLLVFRERLLDKKKGEIYGREVFRELCESKKKNYRAVWLWAEALLDRGNKEGKAFKLFERVINEVSKRTEDPTLAYIRQSSIRSYVYLLVLHNLRGLEHPAVHDILEEMVLNEDTYAMLILGKIYYEGKGVTADYARAKELFKQAAEMDEKEAFTSIGIMYLEGKGVVQNEKTAFYYFDVAATRKCYQGMNNLAYMYDNGIGVKKNQEKARDLYTIAAFNENGQAFYSLGAKHYYGTGVEKDKELAFLCYKNALRCNYPEAYNVLAYLYAHGEGCTKDLEEAFRCELEVARINGEEALLSLGMSYWNGEGSLQSLHQAMKCFKLAADQECAEAAYMMGVIQQDNKIDPDALLRVLEEPYGPLQNYTEAVNCYLRAIRYGHEQAKLKLKGIFFSVAKYGVLLAEFHELEKIEVLRILRQWALEIQMIIASDEQSHGEASPLQQVLTALRAEASSCVEIVAQANYMRGFMRQGLAYVDDAWKKETFDLDADENKGQAWAEKMETLAQYMVEDPLWENLKAIPGISMDKEMDERLFHLGEFILRQAKYVEDPEAYVERAERLWEQITPDSPWEFVIRGIILHENYDSEVDVGKFRSFRKHLGGGPRYMAKDANLKMYEELVRTKAGQIALSHITTNPDMDQKSIKQTFKQLKGDLIDFVKDYQAFKGPHHEIMERDYLFFTSILRERLSLKELQELGLEAAKATKVGNFAQQITKELQEKQRKQEEFFNLLKEKELKEKKMASQTTP